LFANEVGGIVNPSNLRNRSLKALLKMLGHSSIVIILDAYSHVLPNMQQSGVRALEEA
jgi:hypothetical protein